MEMIQFQQTQDIDDKVRATYNYDIITVPHVVKTIRTIISRIYLAAHPIRVGVEWSPRSRAKAM